MKLPNIRYAIQRDFPFRRLSLYMLLIIASFATLFSIVNYVLDGFYLQVEHRINPNFTHSDLDWSHRGFWGKINKAQANCESRSIDTGKSIYTSKLSLPYIVTAVWQEHNDSTIEIVPSLSYLNEVLTNCTISLIQIDLSSYDDRTAEQSGWISWGSRATVCATHGRQMYGTIVHKILGNCNLHYYRRN